MHVCYEMLVGKEYYARKYSLLQRKVPQMLKVSPPNYIYIMYIVY